MIHDRLADAGADFAVLTGYEVPEWFAAPGVSHERPQTWGRDQAFDAMAAEHRAVREAVGVMDMTFMASLLVQGPDALALLQPRERRPDRRARRQDRLHALVHAQGSASGPT